MIPLYIIGYIFYSIYCIFSFFSKLVSNLFEQKCCKSADEIVAISYYSEEWPSVVAFTLFYDKYLLPKDLKLFDSDIEIEKKDFESLMKAVEDNNILKCKTYVLNFPLVSIFTYILYHIADDAGPTDQVLVCYFKDGTKKTIRGYSKALECFRKKLEEMLPEELFY